MVIAGFQALSLLDYPGRSCSIVFTQGCPFRCPYCHNPELISTRPPSSITETSVIRYLLKHRKMLDGVCITGGEPTIQTDLRRFMECIKDIGLRVKLDTNGICPNVMRAIVADHLVDFIAMDLKHTWKKYRHVIRVGGERLIESCHETFDIIQGAGIDHEFRTTVAPALHDEEDLVEMASYLRPGEKYALQEVHYRKTLDPKLPRGSPINLMRVTDRLRAQYPLLHIELRSV